MKHTILFLLAALSASAAPILWSIGGDALGTPNQLIRIDVGASSAAAFATLGAGSTGYGGGIAWLSPGTFIGFESDSSANVTGVSYTTAGAVTPLGALGAFQGGGIALVSGTGYWITNDTLGNSTLTNNTTVNLSLGQGFTGGLAYRPSDGFFYAIGNDSFGNSSLYRIDAGTSTVSVLGLALGQGFLGGLAYDAADDLFYAIASDSFGQSLLHSFRLTDSSSTGLFGVGQGVVFAALTMDEGGGGEVPEPSSVMLAALGGAMFIYRAVKSKKC